MVRNSLLGGIFSAFESDGSAHGAEPIDEYRELAMLAHAWERGALARPPQTCESFLPVSSAELVRIEDRRIELGIHADVGIVLAEDILTGDVQLHAGRNPSR